MRLSWVKKAITCLTCGILFAWFFCRKFDLWFVILSEMSRSVHGWSVFSNLEFWSIFLYLWSFIGIKYRYRFIPEVVTGILMSQREHMSEILHSAKLCMCKHGLNALMQIIFDPETCWFYPHGTHNDGVILFYYTGTVCNQFEFYLQQTTDTYCVFLCCLGCLLLEVPKKQKKKTKYFNQNYIFFEVKYIFFCFGLSYFDKNWIFKIENIQYFLVDIFYSATNFWLS